MVTRPTSTSTPNPSHNTKQLMAKLDDAVLISAVDSCRGPLILTDNQQPDNPIVYCNQAFLDLSGYTMEAVIGQNCRFLQGDDSDPAAIESLRRAVKTGTTARVTLKNYHRNGRPFWNDLVISPITDDAGTVTHFMGVQLDITERIQAEDNLVAKTEALERSNHELEQFTYATSHDLQEPLRMISSYLQLINKRYTSGLDEDAQTFLGFATEGAERMQELITDLLMLSRVDMGAGDNFKLIEMDEAVERALFNVRLAVEESGADIRIEPLPKLMVDVVQMTQLFQNLIGNALKYRAELPPIINISAVKTDESYCFSVADNGIGIDKKDFKRIFAVFQRLHTRSEYAGTGVGLAICAKIVERHRGKLWVESKPGQGAVFKFTIPAQNLAKAELASNSRTKKGTTNG